MDEENRDGRGDTGDEESSLPGGRPGFDLVTQVFQARADRLVFFFFLWSSGVVGG